MTIEERAAQYADKYNTDYGTWNDYAPLEEGYIKGATDQRKIDIENACEWLKRHTNDKWVYDGKEYEGSIITAFRKAMEQ